ncbi:MAG TPA: hypothetical protein PK796_07475 [Bacteroidales bacterium]|nr:hypothetical protein [Paludibacteraceae bacterium]HPT14612.1 hypothetical protein [Bacteroidales bacterium]
MKMTNRWLMMIMVMVFIVQPCFSQTKEKIDQANAKGKVVFLAVTNGNVKLNEVRKVAQSAQKKFPASEVITFDKSDKSNAALVTKYGLLGAPVPIILVIAPNGAVGGGFTLDKATPESLVKLIPTKKQATALLAFSEGKAAFIVLSKKSMKDKTPAVAECKKALSAIGGRGVIIDLDLGDKTESKFVDLLDPDMSATSSHIMVFNGKGQFTGEFSAPVQSKDLVASSKKVVSSCCPSGSGAGCGKK